LICETEKNKKYQEIIQMRNVENSKAPPFIVKADWIFRCLTEGKMSDESDFIFEGK